MENKLRIKNILITGLPGVGKTTLIKDLYNNLISYNPVGFYTQEIRENNIRRGFELMPFDGKKSVLSHVDIKGPYRVGKYGVDIESFEHFMDEIDFHSNSRRMIIIDEIGKMECLSRKFQNLITDLLDSEKLLLATIALKGGGLIDKIKRRHDVAIFKLSYHGRKTMISQIISFIKSL